MDLVFFALESPLFPGALLALFFALAARALTKEPELVLSEKVHPLAPAPRRRSTPRTEIRASTPPAAPPTAPNPFHTTASTPSPQPLMTEEVGTAICSEPDSEPFASDEPIRWL